MLKGYRTYISIGLTAVVIGLHQMGVIPTMYFDTVVAVLTAAGLYFRSKA